MQLTLSLLGDRYAVSRLDPRAPLPSWCEGEGLVSITRTPEELSIVCPSARVPDGIEGAGARVEPGWRCLRFHGPFDFAMTGVLASAAHPLADAGVSIFAVSTFDTDYLLVREADAGRAVATLRRAGHTVLPDAEPRALTL